jgi:hypothetical protein
VPAEIERGDERVADALGHLGHVLRPLDAVEQDGELVAAEARDRVHLTHAAFQAAREIDEQAVAEVVA